ncbi:MAG: oligosaccharide repeat unit polymerase, partial [Bacteroidota bacterium]
TAIVLIGLYISAATYVKSVRGTIENCSATSKQLNKLNTGAVISPSIYLYASAHVGVYSQFLYMDYDYRAMPGETTFQPVYNFLSKFGFVKHPRFYESGYYIPMWTNTATYLRTIHEDFGPVGNFVFPFILGLLASYFWYRFYENGKLLDLVLLAHVYLIVFFSFLVMVTRYGMWFISLAALLLLLPLIEKYISYKKRSQDGAKVLPDQPR